ncbi:MAG: DUF1294 domain-containing protein [Eubacteriales bacterium]|nr:DUF1294 domain-containing protein [Eubacteriales bacterium]
MNSTWLLVIAALPIALNAVSFLLMRYDKGCARRGARRVPEKTLFLAAACFGGLGGTLGMFLCHHKTKHWYFRVFFPLLLLVQIVVLFLLARAVGLL